MNLVVHAMQGFDYSRAERVLAVAQPYAIEALIAVGYPGDIDSMSELLQEREKPSPRKRIGEFVCEGHSCANKYKQGRCSPRCGLGAMLEQHKLVILMVVDGLRGDMVAPEFVPQISAIAGHYRRHCAVFPSVTR